MKKYPKLYPERNSALHGCDTILTPSRRLMYENKSRVWPNKKSNIAETWFIDFFHSMKLHGL